MFSSCAPTTAPPMSSPPSPAPIGVLSSCTSRMATDSTPTPRNVLHLKRPWENCWRTPASTSTSSSRATRSSIERAVWAQDPRLGLWKEEPGFSRNQKIFLSYTFLHAWLLQCVGLRWCSQAANISLLILIERHDDFMYGTFVQREDVKKSLSMDIH